jgi:hypothetical protein
MRQERELEALMMKRRTEGQGKKLEWKLGYSQESPIKRTVTCIPTNAIIRSK